MSYVEENFKDGLGRLFYWYFIQLFMGIAFQIKYTGYEGGFISEKRVFWNLDVTT